MKKGNEGKIFKNFIKALFENEDVNVNQIYIIPIIISSKMRKIIFLRG